MFSIPDFIGHKRSGIPIAMLTCYDSWTAPALVDGGIDAILVGDSAAMVVHGHGSTLTADTAMIASHVRAVRAGAPEACIIADMPFLSTRRGLAGAVDEAGRLMQAGANGVKIEGLPGHEELIPHLIASGIPVMGHLGLQPQSVNLSGGFRVQGRDESAAVKLQTESLALEKLGCFAIVLECIPSSLAQTVTASLAIPTIGIGAGDSTDGQILVLQDMLGFGAAKHRTPRFVRRYLRGTAITSQTVQDFVADVRRHNFPTVQESYSNSTAPITPILIRDPLEWKAFCRSLARRGSLGFVPTMGALHAGHLSLVNQSQAGNDFTLVSIFVNPAQFNDPADLAAYPRTLEADCKYLASVGVHAVFAPESAAIYPDGYHFQMTENELSKKWDGAFRPGHFDGVLSVVLKLLLLTGADRAYFGEKDWQQLQLVRGMVQAMFLDTAIMGCPIQRADSGLALSSRNSRLSAAGLEKAAAFNRILRNSSTAAAAHAELEKAGFKVDYVDDDTTGNRRLAAVWLEGIRLIDNFELTANSGSGGAA